MVFLVTISGCSCCIRIADGDSSTDVPEFSSEKFALLRLRVTLSGHTSHEGSWTLGPCRYEGMLCTDNERCYLIVGILRSTANVFVDVFCAFSE